MECKPKKGWHVLCAKRSLSDAVSVGKFSIEKEKEMAIRKVRYQGDECLRKKCKVVKEMTPRVQQLIDDMFETMYEHYGVGLAAPQVGILKRIVVIDVQDGNPLALINPEIIEKSGEQTDDEGCLSFPGKVAKVTRANHVICKALDENFEPIEIEGEGLLARAIQHEVDHLDGILYPDRADEPIRDVEEEEA